MARVPVLPTTWIKSCQEMFLNGKYGQKWTFKGTTTNNTATEIFLEGMTNKRLYLPKSAGACFGKLNVLAYNQTDGNVMTCYRDATFAVERLANGTFQAANGVDFDGSGGEGAIVTLGTAAQGIGVIEFGASAQVLGVAVQGSGAANDPYIEVKVTGQNSKTILWLAIIDPILYRGIDDDATMFDAY